MDVKSTEFNLKGHLAKYNLNNTKKFGFKNFFSAVLIIFSGVFVFLVASWNSTQANILLRWSAEREGQAIFSRIMHESGISSWRAYRNPQLLYGAVSGDSQIISAGIIFGDTIVASFTNSKAIIIPFKQFPPTIGTEILSEELTVFRKQTGPTKGSRGPRWQRERIDEASPKNAALSFYFVFKGPDSKITNPLIYQKYLWPIVWLMLSVFWATILFKQAKIANLREKMQQDAHLAAVGKMSARLAHEIKNPLGAVRGMAQLLSKKLTAKPELLDMTNTIEKETFRLEELARNILDFSRLPKLNLIKLNLNSLLADRISLTKVQRSDYQFKVTLLDEPVFCNADENATAQIIQNLLNNAVEATEPSQTIEIELKYEAKHAIIQIRNVGELCAEELKNKFEPFYSTKVNGYGLGLAISKKLTELQGGSLKLENGSDHKVLAVFSLPGSKK